MSWKHRLLPLLPASWKSRLRAWRASRHFRRFRAEDWAWSPILRPLLAPGDAVVDAGANIGYLSRLFADWVGSGGKVFAFEPVPETYALLFANVSRNALRAITPFPLGLSDVAAEVRFAIPAYGGGGENFYESHIVSGHASAGVREVRARVAPLDPYLAQLPKLALVKIDVEGHEAAVVRGALACIDAHRPALLIEVQGEPATRPETTGLWDLLTRERPYRPFVLDGQGGLRSWVAGCGAVDVLFLTEAHLRKTGSVPHA